MIEAVAVYEPRARIVGVSHLVGGVSALVVRLDLDLDDDGLKRRVVFRQHSDKAQKNHTDTIAAKEFAVLEHLSRAGVAVPTPLATSTSNNGQGPWLLLEWIEGSTELTPAWVNIGLDAMVDFLHVLQAVALPTTTLPGIEPIENPEEAIVPHLPDDEIGRALAEHLAAGIKRSPNQRVLLHGDYWPGNVLFHEGSLVAVIDWEDAAVGDPLVDLATARVELICAYGQAAVDRFTERFLGQTPPLDLTDLPLWDIYVSATALSAMHLWGLSPEEEAKRRQATRDFFERAAEEIVSLRSRPAIRATNLAPRYGARRHRGLDMRSPTRWS